ncbi:alpha/beta fold hydrolase [Erythrobacter sp. SD-21]|uniref:alpha/beta fold hydrolase n=1 Tax=Erythrobacter sp. SD-21 TaxID=161528 RepID=UPI000153F46F|nr:alpha/beta fold hydrolase [Erythrobacter sp. SD-21]EDL50494.1 Poly(3-hydroxyalkanoate) depolymerase [Erythrobacter sp. SD-21]
MTASKDEPQKDLGTATVEMIEAGGRTLRVAHWRLDKPSDHAPILFFNGIGANIEAVAPLAERLTERAFIIFDMPGTGESPDPTVPYNPFTMSWTATQILDQLGVDEVDVMGVSWGGAMAQHFALQHPGRTRRLVLVATTAGMLMVPGNPAALSKMANPRRYVDSKFMNEHFMMLYGGMTKRPGSKEDHIGRLKPPSPRGYLYQLVAMLGWTSLPGLPFMNKEVLIMMGDEDQIVPLVNGKILNTMIRNSRLEVFKGGGHLFLLTHADESVASIRFFLDAPSTEAESRRAA